MKSSLSSIFSNKNILITGHTGFKGSWLSAIFHHLGANVYGLSNCVPTNPSHFSLFENLCTEDFRLNITDTQSVLKTISSVQPDYIFHLAAQPIVHDSYSDPLNTFHVNAMGTTTILEYLRSCIHHCVSIFITSDKAYDNVEWTYGYRENDRLGGSDPYSASKGAAELIIKSYFNSFISKSSNVKLGVGRAGNVIGGGDWAPYRIIPDCVRSWSVGAKPEIRCPHATRPWQHVLEPLSGYITLAASLSRSDNLNGEAFNFGPPSSQNHSVEELVEEMIVHWDGNNWIDKSSGNEMPPEAGLLKLCCDKALHELYWKPSLDFNQTARWTAEWYKIFYESGQEKALELTFCQISDYIHLSNLINILQPSERDY